MLHTRFIVLFAAALFSISNALNFGQLAKWFQAGDGLDGLALSAYLLAGLCLFITVLTLLAHRWTLKPLAILLTILSAAATYFIGKYGVAIDSSMVRNVVHTDPTEVGQLLSLQMIPYGVFLMIVPIVAIVRTRITFEPWRYLLGSAKLFFCSLGIALLSLYLQYNAILHAGNVSNKYIVYSLVPINVISGSINATTRAIKPWFRKDQKNLNLAAKVTAPDNLVVVLAIGESARRKNFSLYGYSHKDTNPVLKNTEGLHLLNAVATRASTLYALPKILEKDGIKLTTVVSKAGIPTACYVNYTLYDNCAAVGETKVADCGHAGKCFDEDVIPLLKRDLANYRSGYRFLVLHFGGGSHGPAYNERIPPQFRVFKPTCDDADVANKCSIEQIYNSYDNTILYTDAVLGQAIRTLDEAQVPYVFIYLSDHGESLMEDGVMFHGMPPGMRLPEEQAQIPLIVKASVPLSILNRREYQQPEVFDSVLDLLTIESKFDRAGAFIKKDTRANAAHPEQDAQTNAMRAPPH